MNVFREYWIEIKDHPDYEVSQVGRVRDIRTDRILPQWPNKPGGYLRVYIDGKHHYVHRLVLMSFTDDDGYGKDVNHIDGDKDNNCLWNLEWCTRKENIRHAVDAGLFKRTMKKNKFDEVFVVRCKYCRFRDTNPFCSNRDDDFFCADGEL